MSATEGRLKQLDMINYLKGGSAVAVPHANPHNLTNETLCGKNIGVTKGSTQQLKHLPNVAKWSCEEKGQPAINAITLPNVQEALTQLDSKRIDGVFYDASALAWANEQQPDHFTILEPRMDTRTDTNVAMGSLVVLIMRSPKGGALPSVIWVMFSSPALATRPSADC